MPIQAKHPTDEKERRISERSLDRPDVAMAGDDSHFSKRRTKGSSACNRIAVIGVPCSGKSTLAERLSRALGLARIELDALYWKPGWVGAEREEFRAKVAAATLGERWAVDGNYVSVRDLVWGRADLIVWLDYPLPLVLARWARRTWRRWRTKELLWGTNVESARMELKVWSKTSLIHWVIRCYFRYRRDYPKLLSDRDRIQSAVLRFKHPRETEAWLASLQQGSGCGPKIGIRRSESRCTGPSTRTPESWG